ncbi:MAG: hypothetical protein K1X85_12720 [Ignavibacteria bacterium]|nr:hypothetical protein [Ignavibacteria bacterium]
MTNTALISLLKTFSKQEMRSLGELVSSQSSNNRTSVRRLFTVLSELHPDFRSEESGPEIIFEKVFPGKRYNSSSLRPIMHYLNELALDYLTVKDFRNSRLTYDFHRITALIERRQFTAAGKTLAKATEKVMSRNVNAAQQYYHGHLFKNLKLVLTENIRDGIYQKFLPEIQTNDVYRDLSAFYSLRTLQMYINVLNINRLYGTKLPASDFAGGLKQLDERIVERNPVIELFLCLSKMLSEKESLPHYRKARAILKKHGNSMNREDLHEIYVNLENYCNDRILAGDRMFEKEKFSVYKEEIGSGVYLFGGMVSPIFLKSAVSLALRLREYKWARDFLDSHIEHVEKKPTLRNSYLFSLASYEFAMKDFGSALEHLSKLEFDDAYMEVDSKIIQLLIFYETGSFETLEHSLKAFSRFLRTDKGIPMNRKANYLNFYRYFRKLVLLKEKKDIPGMKLLRRQIDSEGRLSQKQWLLKAADQDATILS